MFPEVRAERLKELAARVRNEFAGNLCQALRGPLSQARKNMKQFHSIGDPGADRILLFAGITSGARARAYLLLKRHGQELCKASKPKCHECPVTSACAYTGA